jgi:drug/metabolite transporter (DMT)-like permease
MSAFRPPAAPPLWQIAIGFAILYVVWGTTYLAIKIGVGDEHLPPYLFGGSRIGLAGLVLLGIQAIRGQSLRFGRGEWPGLLYGTLFLFIGGNGLISYSLQFIPSGESAVLAATTTLWIALFSSCVPGGDRVRPLGWFGVVLGIAGVLVLESPMLRETGFSFTRNAGPWFALASAGAWGIGSVLTRLLPSKMPRLTASGWLMTLGGVGQLAVGLVIGERPSVTVAPATIAVFAYLLLFSSLIAFVAFQWLLHHVAATKVGTYAYVNPLVAVLLGAWWREEPLTAELFGGMAIILVAVFLVRGPASAGRDASDRRAVDGE